MNFDFLINYAPFQRLRIFERAFYSISNIYRISASRRFRADLFKKSKKSLTLVKKWLKLYLQNDLLAEQLSH